ncbi:hypothetical protein CXB51_008003 [Gossypium anomalum]|uniref:DUF7745 domain-containing protein n=1 Tax=Gossypium anomalum TaxID=47600 RepID=A0A8J5ZA91_9ROSI|nr:hypothetical protein CXB51_008003 [Gossypium anomalum]
MENGLLDRVEGNADVHRWSEQTHLEKGDSITMGYVSEFCFTFGEVDLVPTVEEYTALLRYPRFQNDRIYSQAACVPTIWKKLMTITGMSEQWITARIKEKGECKCISWDALKDLILTHPDEMKNVDIFALSLYGLMVFPRALGYVDEETTNLFHQLNKRVTSVPVILAETFRSLGACRKAGAGRFIGCAQLLMESGCADWIALLQNLQSGDVDWRAPWMDAIGYAPLLVLRQHGLRQFVPTTHGLAQSEFVYRGADYKRKVSEVSSTWNKTCQLKGVAIGLDATPEYVEWMSRRINDNVPMTKIEEAQPMEEYLQVIPSEIDIIKKKFKRKNLELEKKIEKLEEEKMYLSLDVDLQKKEVEKVRKEKRKVEEDRDDLKEEYNKAQERKFQEIRSQNLALENENKGLKTKIEQLEAQKDCIKGELHQVKGQVMDRNYIIGEAIAQIRETAEYVRDLAVRVDALSIMYESSSDKGRELALLSDKVRTLGIRAKAYM